MAEFQKVMRQWERMCEADKDTIYSSICTRCPMAEQISACHAIYDKNNDDIDWDKVYQIVMSWAAEHPEPVYPTWAEWLDSMEVVVNGANAVMMKPKMLNHIPAYIAQKLGIEPKEG